MDASSPATAEGARSCEPSYTLATVSLMSTREALHLGPVVTVALHRIATTLADLNPIKLLQFLRKTLKTCKESYRKQRYLPAYPVLHQIRCFLLGACHLE